MSAQITADRIVVENGAIVEEPPLTESQSQILRLCRAATQATRGPWRREGGFTSYPLSNVGPDGAKGIRTSLIASGLGEMLVSSGGILEHDGHGSVVGAAKLTPFLDSHLAEVAVGVSLTETKQRRLISRKYWNQFQGSDFDVKTAGDDENDLMDVTWNGPNHPRDEVGRLSLIFWHEGHDGFHSLVSPFNEPTVLGEGVEIVTSTGERGQSPLLKGQVLVHDALWDGATGVYPRSGLEQRASEDQALYMVYLIRTLAPEIGAIK